MNCEDVELKIPDLVAGRLDADEAARVEAAISLCPHCESYRAQIASFYALDLDTEIDIGPFPVPSLPGRRRIGLLRVAAAAAVLLMLVLGLRQVLRDEDRGLVAAVDLQPLAVVLPELPPHGGDGLWADDVESGRLLASYLGKPLATVYLFPYCPRCESMLDRFESNEFHSLMADFVHVKVSFVEEIPPALAARQHEVEDTMYVHTPAIVISGSGADLPALYDVTNLEMIRGYLDCHLGGSAREKKRPLDAQRFARYRELVIGLPERLDAGDWGGALLDLEEAMLDGRRYRGRFFTDFERLHREITTQIEARITHDERRLARGEADARAARATLEAMRAALGEHALGTRIGEILAR